MVVDNVNGLADYDETNYIPRGQLRENDDMASNQSQSVKEVKVENAPGWYAKDYNPENVAHIL